jgi:hypothetical protein
MFVCFQSVCAQIGIICSSSRCYPSHHTTLHSSETIDPLHTHTHTHTHIHPALPSPLPQIFYLSPLTLLNLITIGLSLLLYYLLSLTYSFSPHIPNLSLAPRPPPVPPSPLLGVTATHEVESTDDQFDQYRKRMMLAYRFRPNPLNNPRRDYY